MSNHQLSLTVETEEGQTLSLSDVKECQEWLDKLVNGVESGELSIEGGGSICITHEANPTLERTSTPEPANPEPANPTIDDDTMKAIALGMLGVGQ